MKQIKIFDTTLRDGEQSPGCSMNLKEKLQVAECLEKLKVDVIEAGFAIAAPGDFDTEYLDYKLSVAVVPSLEDAVAHIAAHSTHHSEAIVTGDKAAAQRFVTCVDSAAVYVNASTRFTDGGEFGLGCEMGISTQKLHARGPMGLAELCTYKYIIHGSGQTRGGASAAMATPCR